MLTNFMKGSGSPATGARRLESGIPVSVTGRCIGLLGNQPMERFPRSVYCF